MIKIIDKYKPREYTSFATDSGVVLCDKQDGAFLVLRFTSDLEKLKELLNKIEVIEGE